MQHITCDEKWTFRRGMLDSLGMMENDPGVEVNLPHDGMISLPVSPEAPAGYDSGYFPGDTCNYTKMVFIPGEWADDCVGLQFDGAMMHTVVDVNGCKVAEHHYGYSPFYVDITDYVSFGEENRITINLNTGVQSSSRWYTGSGLFRGVVLCHSPKVHIQPDGVYVYTKEVAEDMAFLEAQVDIGNATGQNRLVKVTVALSKEENPVGDKTPEATVTRVIQVNAGKQETARMAMHLNHPLLWDSDHPNLYEVKVTATDLGIYRTHFEAGKENSVDEETVLFGIRTITADAVRGLRINGKTVKLKGGCIHHDNGLLGAVSLYESEARKVMKLKEVGFNAIRTAHNPPSSALVEACDRLGMYLFDEAFDAWGMAKRPGDYSQYFKSLWKEDLAAFVRRDRVHPSVIMWSTGNEIPERGGLNNGYKLATELAEAIRKLDATRPISNGICSFWSGFDDYMAKGQDQSQNAKNNEKNAWETNTEPFTNGLDIVGYNYMEELYEKDHMMYPERVILGSENFPKEIGYRWPVVEALPYVIGDFTWTAWDYLGEAGIGKAVHVEPGDPLIEKGSWAIMPPTTSPYPWRTANDADFDITGRMLPQGAYRSVVWGSEKTYLFSWHPSHYGKVEMVSMWGFPEVIPCWNYAGYEGKPVELVVFSNADEVELVLNGQTLERKAVVKDGEMPGSVRFRTIFTPGKLEAVSYKNGNEVSRDFLETSKAPFKLRVTPEKTTMYADGHDLIYVNIDVVDEEDRLVTDGVVELTASLEGGAALAGFGTGNPITEENYTDNQTVSFRGHATAIVRSGYEEGKTTLTISAEGMAAEQVTLLQR